MFGTGHTAVPADTLNTRILKRSEFQEQVAKAHMAVSEVQIPICCVTCGAQALSDFPIAVVVVALTSWKQMRLYADCCTAAWDASPSDLQRIREHVGDEWIESARQQFAAETYLLLDARQRLAN